MKGSDKTFIILLFYMGIGFLFLLYNMWSYFLFWEFTFGIGGSIFLWQEEKKAKSDVK